jgi:hypothetical protein
VQREREHPAHAAQQADVLRPERLATHTGEHEPTRRIVVERDDSRRARPDAGQLEPVDASGGGQVDELRRGEAAAREPDGRDDGARADNRAELRLECLGRALDRFDRRGVLVAAGRDGGEELGQLVGGPGAECQFNSPPE